MSADEEPGDEAANVPPPMPPVVLLAVVGLLCGFLVVGLVWLSDEGCARSRDAGKCGSLGLPLLILSVVVAMVLGTIALRRLALENPGLVSFFGVAFMCLIVLGVLSERLYSTWTLLIVPGLTAITFLVADLLAKRLNRADA